MARLVGKMAQRLIYKPSFAIAAPFSQTTFSKPGMANPEQIKKNFLSSPSFAVVGASKDQTKFGTKVDFGQCTATSDSQPAIVCRFSNGIKPETSK
jgi:hypothetical protein